MGTLEAGRTTTFWGRRVKSVYPKYFGYPPNFSRGQVDFWILTDEPFDHSRFARRYPEEFMGLKMQVSSPEDTILVKLRWANLSGGSEKQFTDALRVYEVQYEKLDIDYLECWAKKLDIELLWNRLKHEAEVA